MNVHEFTEGLNKTLCEFYGKKIFDATQIALWFKKMSWLHPRDFLSAVDEITTCEKLFPTPQMILKYAEESRKRRRSQELEADKNRAQDFFKPEKHMPGIGRDCVQLSEALDSLPRASIEKIEFEVEGYKALMKKYPQAGFDVNYRKALERLNSMKSIDVAKIY